MAGKRSRAATKGLRPKKVITAKQRAARKVNIEVARRAKKSGTKGSSKGAGAKRPWERSDWKKKQNKQFLSPDPRWGKIDKLRKENRKYGHM